MVVSDAAAVGLATEDKRRKVTGFYGVLAGRNRLVAAIRYYSTSPASPLD
jgi:hypothetical protein